MVVVGLVACGSTAPTAGSPAPTPPPTSDDRGAPRVARDREPVPLEEYEDLLAETAIDRGAARVDIPEGPAVALITRFDMLSYTEMAEEILVVAVAAYDDRREDLVDLTADGGWTYGVRPIPGGVVAYRIRGDELFAWWFQWDPAAGDLVPVEGFEGGAGEPRPDWIPAELR